MCACVCVCVCTMEAYINLFCAVRCNPAASDLLPEEIRSRQPCNTSCWLSEHTHTHTHTLTCSPCHVQIHTHGFATGHTNNTPPSIVHLRCSFRPLSLPGCTSLLLFGPSALMVSIQVSKPRISQLDLLRLTFPEQTGRINNMNNSSQTVKYA